MPEISRGRSGPRLWYSRGPTPFLRALGQRARMYWPGYFHPCEIRFDTVDHNILLNRLDKIGIGQKVEIYQTEHSQPLQTIMYLIFLPINCGELQGSVLGPTLFLIYINDVKNVLKNVNHMLYADDTALYLSGDDLDELESTDVQNIVSYETFKSYQYNWQKNVTIQML